MERQLIGARVVFIYAAGPLWLSLPVLFRELDGAAFSVLPDALSEFWGCVAILVQLSDLLWCGWSDFLCGVGDFGWRAGVVGAGDFDRAG